MQDSWVRGFAMGFEFCQLVELRGCLGEPAMHVFRSIMGSTPRNTPTNLAHVTSNPRLAPGLYTDTCCSSSQSQHTQRERERGREGHTETHSIHTQTHQHTNRERERDTQHTRAHTHTHALSNAPEKWHVFLAGVITRLPAHVAPILNTYVLNTKR